VAKQYMDWVSYHCPAKQYMEWVSYHCPNQDLVRSNAGEDLVVSIVGETKRLFCEQIIPFPHGTLICETFCMSSVPLENVPVDQDGETIKCGLSLFDANRVGHAKYDKFFITAKHVVFDIDIQTTCDVKNGVQIIFTRPGSNIKVDENVEKRIRSKITDMTHCDQIETISVGSKYSVALTFEEAANRKEVLEAVKDKTVVIDGADHTFTSCMRKAELDDKKEQLPLASTETIAFATTTDTSTEATSTTSTTTSTTGSTIMETTSTTTDKGSTTKETATPSTSNDILFAILIAISLSSLILNIFNTFKNGCTQTSHQEAAHNPTDNHTAQDKKEDADAANTDVVWSDLTETLEDIMRNKEAEDLLIREEGPSTSTVNNADKKNIKSSCFTIQVEPERSQLLPKPKKLKKPAAEYLESNSTPMSTLN